MVALGLCVLAGCWVGFRSYQVYRHLQEASRLVSGLQAELASLDGSSHAKATLANLQEASSAARSAAHDPLFRVAAVLPWVGPNLEAVGTIADTVDNLAVEVMPELVDIADTITPAAIAPKDGAVDVQPIIDIAPALRRAALAMDASVALVTGIDRSALVSPVDAAVVELLAKLAKAQSLTDAADRIARLLPPMMGAAGPRTYLLVFQNLAEPRATGGFFGSVALLSTDHGKVTVGTTDRAGKELGTFDPPISGIDPALSAFYGPNIGMFPGSANFSPNFPTGAEILSQMYELRTGIKVDGVLAADPVALSYLMAQDAPLDVGGGVVLDSSTVADFFLSGIYAKFALPPETGQLEDTAAREEFTATAFTVIAEHVLGGGVGGEDLISGLRRGMAEHRLLMWSARSDEQATLAETSLSGQLPTTDINGPSIGVFLNDGSGAKLGYYLRSSASVEPLGCAPDGSTQLRVTITLRDESPSAGLPRYVADSGYTNNPPYRLRTNVMVMVPLGGGVISAKQDGHSVDIGTGIDNVRSLAVVTVDLTPSASSELALIVRAPPNSSWPQVVAPTLYLTPLVEPWETSVTPFARCGG